MKKYRDVLRRDLTALSATTMVLGFIVFSVVVGLLVAGLALPFTSGVGLAAKAAANNFENLPSDFKTPTLEQRTTIEAADGSTIATVADPNFQGNRVVVNWNQISKYVPDALVSIEDSRYWTEGAIDFKGTLRALLHNSGGGATQGGSGLVQQYVKNVLLYEAGTNKAAQEAAIADTTSRKIKELRLAVAVNKEYSKQDILTRYLNLVNFGEGAYGIEAAAERYFSTSAQNLTIPQAATLAAIVNAPSYYDPLSTQGAVNVLQRRNVVLQKMQQQNYITMQQYNAAVKTPLGTKSTPAPEGCLGANGDSAFFCVYVIDEILNNSLYGANTADRKKFLYSGLTIKTTMSPKDENSAQNAVTSRVSPTDQIASSIAMITPGTGAITAIAQSRPYGYGSGQTTFVYAADKSHGGTPGYQAGSTFKLFIGLAALENGMNPGTSLNVPNKLDGQALHDGGTSLATCVNGQNGSELWDSTYSPANDSTSEQGKFTMQQAYAASINTYFLTLEQQTGVCKPAQIAESMGVTVDSDSGTGAALGQFDSFTLGTNYITPVEMANAYATVAAQGVYCKPIVLTGITDDNGKSYAVPQANCHQVISSSIANTMTSMLQTVLQNGGTAAGDGLNDGRPAAGKTGTSDTQSMTWFDGYTPGLAAAVYTGNPDAPNHSYVNGVTAHGVYYSGLFGATISAPDWKDAMDSALSGDAIEQFSTAGIIQPVNNNPNPNGGNTNGGANGGNAGNTGGNNNGGILGGVIAGLPSGGVGNGNGGKKH